MNNPFPFFGRVTLLIGGFVAACTSAAHPHANDSAGGAPANISGADAGASGDESDRGTAGAAGTSGKKGSSPHAGAGGGKPDASLGGAADSGVHVSGVPGDGAMTANAGARDDAGTGADGGTSEPETECNIDGGCAAVCHGQTARCAVELAGFSCELDQFQGAEATVTCGDKVAVGTTSCGACGSVAVQVFFDGTRCWQGIPDCQQPGFLGTFFLPHDPK